MWHFKILTFVIVSSFLFTSCGWNKVCVEQRSNYSFIAGEEKTTVVGSEMLQTSFPISQCVKYRYDPTGLNLTLLKKEAVILNEMPYAPTIEKELLYAGREGSVLHITYREYTWQGHARVPFFQSLYYDLKHSDKIVFQNWTIQILDANNEKIVFKILKE